jgi:hypothetical protein
MDLSQNIGSTFSEKSDKILAEIMERYKLEETLEEERQKEKEGKIYNEVLLTMLSMAFLRKKISENDILNNIKQEIGVPQQTALEISRDIIKNLIPTILTDEDMAKKYKEDSLKKPEKNIYSPSVKAPIWVEEALQRQKIMPPEKMPTIEPEMPESTPSFESTPEPAPKKGPGRPKKSQLPEEPIEEKPAPSKSRKGPDSYREPIG